jgi:hypothetical protein
MGTRALLNGMPALQRGSQALQRESNSFPRKLDALQRGSRAPPKGTRASPRLRHAIVLAPRQIADASVHDITAGRRRGTQSAAGDGGSFALAELFLGRVELSRGKRASCTWARWPFMICVRAVGRRLRAGLYRMRVCREHKAGKIDGKMGKWKSCEDIRIGQIGTIELLILPWVSYLVDFPPYVSPPRCVETNPNNESRQ